MTDTSVTQKVFYDHEKQGDRRLSELTDTLTGYKATQVKLFEKINELSDKTETRFTSVEGKASDRHVELLNAIYAIKAK